MQFPILAEGRVTPGTVHGNADETGSQFTEIRKHFIIERYLVATHGTPISRVKNKHDRLSAKFT